MVVHGTVREVAGLATLPIGTEALGFTPRNSVRRGVGKQSVTLTFAEMTTSPGDRVYVDADGVVILPS